MPKVVTNKMKPGDMYNAYKKKLNLGDMRLNKAGTVGTEPISKNGKMYTELKFGKLGKIDIPNKNAAKKLKTKKKNWIAGAIKKPGALHKELGIKSGKKIPAKTLAKAAKKGGKLGMRARLAETLKSFHHKMKCKKHKKMKCKMCK